MDLPKCSECPDISGVCSYTDGDGDPSYLCTKCAIRKVRVAPVVGLLLSIRTHPRALVLEAIPPAQLDLGPATQGEILQAEYDGLVEGVTETSSEVTPEQ
jgi:hypothetical protein